MVALHVRGLYSSLESGESPWFTPYRKMNVIRYQSYIRANWNTLVIPNWSQACHCCCCVCYPKQYLRLVTVVVVCAILDSISDLSMLLLCVLSQTVSHTCHCCCCCVCYPRQCLTLVTAVVVCAIPDSVSDLSLLLLLLCVLSQTVSQTCHCCCCVCCPRQCLTLVTAVVVVCAVLDSVSHLSMLLLLCVLS